MQATSLVQEMNGGNIIALKYKDMRNGKETYFVKVASAGSDQIFTKYSKWLRRALHRNRGDDGIVGGTKRATKWMHNNQPEAFQEAMTEMALALPGKMRFYCTISARMLISYKFPSE